MPMSKTEDADTLKEGLTNKVISIVLAVIVAATVLVPIADGLADAGPNNAVRSVVGTAEEIYTNTGDYYYSPSDNGDITVSIYSVLNDEGTVNETISIFVDVEGYEVSFTGIPNRVENTAGQMDRLNEHVISLPLAWGYCEMEGVEDGQNISGTWEEILILKGSYGRSGGSSPSQYESYYHWNVLCVDIDEIGGERMVSPPSICSAVSGEGTEADPYIYEYGWTAMADIPDMPYEFTAKHTKMMLAASGDWVYSENPVYSDEYYQFAVGNHYFYDYNSANYYEYIEYEACTLIDADRGLDESIFSAYLYRTYGYHGRIESDDASIHHAVSSYGDASINKTTSAIYTYTYSNQTNQGFLEIEEAGAIVPVSVGYTPMQSGTNPDPFVPMAYSSTPGAFRITVDAESDGEFLTSLTLDSNGSISVPVGEIADELRNADWDNLTERQEYLLISACYPIYMDDEYAVWYHLGGSAYVIHNYDGVNLDVLMGGVNITEVSCDGTNLTVKAEGENDLVVPVSGANYHADAHGTYGAYAPVHIYDNGGLYSPATETPHQLLYENIGTFQYIYGPAAKIGMYDTGWREMTPIQKTENGKLTDVGWDYVLHLSMLGGGSGYRAEQTIADCFILPIHVDNGGSGGGDDGNPGGSTVTGTIIKVIPIFVFVAIILYTMQLFSPKPY